MTNPGPADGLRDYSADSRILYTSALAAGLGAVSAVAAWALLEMIALFTNLFYFQRWSFVSRDPWQAGRHWWLIVMPVLGGLIVGIIARYLSPKVRGHGMPEAVETIVFNDGKVQPRVAILKPIATAIAIGSGGPFGAEGPVIMTGGAVGSIVGQLLPVSGSERTVLMVAGAAAGIAATFNCPMSATLLAVELLLFEWKPRALVPVAIACVVAGTVRRLLLGPQSLLQMVPTGAPIYHSAMLGALALGIVAAFVATGLSKAVYFFERMFERLPIHWMWWPAIGGLGIGLGGWVFPRALGVGYSVMQQMISGDVGWKFLAGILIVKSSYLGVLAGVKHGGQHSGAVAGDRRSAGRSDGASDAGDDDRGMGAGGHDVGALGGDRRTADVGDAGAGIDAQWRADAAGAALLHCGVRGQRAGDAALHADGESQPPRSPPQPRVRRRSARNHPRLPGYAYQRLRAA